MPQIRVHLSEDNQATHELTEDTITLGRLPDNAIQIEDGSVSSHHGQFELRGTDYHFVDAGSTNGTFLNGAQISDAKLSNGDQIRFGNVECVFIGDGAATSEGKALPQTERAAASLGSASARPPTFVNASPFPKPKEKTDGLTYAALALAILGAVGFLASVAISFTLKGA